jgi:hypothetical protein
MTWKELLLSPLMAATIAGREVMLPSEPPAQGPRCCDAGEEPAADTDVIDENELRVALPYLRA